jgi:hypothetical protein
MICTLHIKRIVGQCMMADKTTLRLLTAGRINGEGNIPKGGRRQNTSGVLLAVALTRVASEAGRRSQQRRQ